MNLRLGGKVAVLTGGAGGIGRVVAKRYLEEGATVILTGRTIDKLNAAVSELEALDAKFKNRVFAQAMDGSKPESLREGAQNIASKFSRVDILINNAGSAGPRQELANIPLTAEDLARLRASGSTDTETLLDAVGSLLGSAWYTTRAFLPYLAKGASIINVSTIFSRTEYYGRISYVVPKAALNALSKLMAKEIGTDERGIRVNTVYPGPVESERIHSVFASMDKLKSVEQGTTAKEIVSWMLAQKTPTGTNYLTKEEVANTIVFLGSDESTSYSGHDFEVTHGIQPPGDNYTHVISRPNLRVVDLEERLIWIIAGDQVEQACELATRHHELGADIFLTFRASCALERAREKLDGKPGYHLDLLDPLNLDHWHKAETTLYLKHQLPRATLVLPSFGKQDENGGRYGSSVLKADDVALAEFLNREIAGSITVAQRLDQLFNAADKRLTADPIVVFLTNESDKHGDAFASIQRAGVQELIRIWRHENELLVRAGRRTRKLRLNQLVRYENGDAANLDLTCEWAISLSNGLRQVKAIDLALAPSLAGSTQAQTAATGPNSSWERQALRGLHLRKVALITGGSEGIGGETARLLALAGARVAIAARSLEKLEKARQMIIEELGRAGYSEPASRVLIIPDCDVAEERALEIMVEQTLARFGRIDYLINNAGIAGVEQMVADMPIDGWQRTLMANLISNYDLTLKVLPVMKKQKAGHILNVSSHFGGVRHATVAYPNRTDYAVSKAGQRAMAESLAAILGPDVQINAIAPGPVDGVRLRGSKDRPGLYARRAKLILENKRMNLVYSALVTAFRCNENMNEALVSVAQNEIQALLTESNSIESLRVLAKSLTEKPAKQECASNTHLLTRALAEKLLTRLALGKYMPVGFSRDAFFSIFVDAPEPFLPQSQIDSDADSIRNAVVGTLALERMPSENDVAREMVFYLANRNVTGETLHPSCGLMLDKLTMSGDLVGRAHPDLLNELRHSTVMIFGDSSYEEMAQIAATYCDRHGVKQVVLVVGSDGGRKAVEAALSRIGFPGNQHVATPFFITTEVTKSIAMDRALDRMIAKFGRPDVVVSLPMGELSQSILPNERRPKKDEWRNLPSIEIFKKIVDEQLTAHLVLARRASLIDGCRVVLVTPRLPEKASPQATAMANFVRTSLRPLTVTAGQEGLRLIHKPIFHQIDINSAADPSSIQRFLDAVLLMSLPQSQTPQAGHIRNSSGTTITV